MQFYPQAGGVTGGTDGVTGQFWSIGVGTLIEDQLTGPVLVNKSMKIQVRFKSGFKVLKKQPPGGANRSVSDAEVGRHTHTPHTGCTMKSRNFRRPWLQTKKVSCCLMIVPSDWLRLAAFSANCAALLTLALISTLDGMTLLSMCRIHRGDRS